MFSTHRGASHLNVATRRAWRSYKALGRESYGCFSLPQSWNYANSRPPAPQLNASDGEGSADDKGRAPARPPHTTPAKAKTLPAKRRGRRQKMPLQPHSSSASVGQQAMKGAGPRQHKLLWCRFDFMKPFYRYLHVTHNVCLFFMRNT